MTQTRDVFQAIADPTRREIIGMLASRPLNVNTIASHFDITRQAVSLHIQFLADCNLVTVKQHGRERYCEANLQELDVVSGWVEKSKTVWLQKFRSLETFLASVEKQNTQQTKTKKNGRRK